MVTKHNEVLLYEELQHLASSQSMKVGLH